VNSISSLALPVKVTLSDSPRLVSARSARGLVRRAKYAAVYVTMSAHGAADLLDVSKASALRLLRRHETAWVSVLFGTVCIGRPEPIPCGCRTNYEAA
jgi:hypothetical protein